MKFGPRSLSFALALVATLGLALPAAIVGTAWIGVRDAESLTQRRQQELDGRLNVLARSLPALLWNLDLSSARPLVDAVMASPDVVRVTVIDPQQIQPFLDVDFPQRRHGASHVIERPLRYGNQAVGSFLLELDDSGFNAELRERRRTFAYTIAAQLLVSLGLILYLLNLRVVRPLRELGRFADDLAQGRFGTSLASRHEDEIGNLGKQLVAMRDALQRLFGEQRTLVQTVSAREAEVRRLQSFYAALLNTRQAIAREPDEARLLQEICRICVEVAHAKLAAVRLTGGPAGAVMTYAGEPSEFLAEFFAGGTLSTARNRPVTYRALTTGGHAIENDLAGEGGQHPANQRALHFGVRAIAAFTVKRAGRVAGALTLYAAEAGFFDQAVAELFVDMAADLSNALDNFDRARAVRQATEDARLGFEQFRRVFTSAPVSMMIVAERDQRVAEVNDACRDTLGIAREAIVGRSLSELGFDLAAEDPQRVLERYREQGRVRDMEVRARAAGGRELTLVVSAEPIDYGGERCSLVSALDISAARQASEARAAAEAANQAKSDFLANMSHEIRTPMNAILGFTSLALLTPLTPKQQEYLSKSKVAAQSLLELIDRILDFSKIEAGKLELEQSPFSLADVLDRVTVIVGEKAHQKGLELLTTIAPEVPRRLIGDASRLAQVLTNLCNNAVKFTAAGRIVVAISLLRIERQRATLRFSVRDTGIGLTATERSRLFRPFAQADSSTSRRFGGTGLGLAISRQLVELMGGHIDVTSEPDRGSDFFFTAAFGLLPEVSPAVRVPRDPDPRVLDILRGRRVLLIEDNDFNQLVATELLTSVGGMNVDVAESGQQALDYLGRQRADIILMDVQMPGMDGYETTRRIRADPANAGTPIIAMTAHATARDRADCLAAGMNGYITKPFDAEDLFELIAEWLSRAASPPAQDSVLDRADRAR